MEKNIDRQAVEQERRDRLKREKPLAHGGYAAWGMWI